MVWSTYTSPRNVPMSIDPNDLSIDICGKGTSAEERADEDIVTRLAEGYGFSASPREAMRGLISDLQFMRALGGRHPNSSRAAPAEIRKPCNY